MWKDLLILLFFTQIINTTENPGELSITTGFQIRDLVGQQFLGCTGELSILVYGTNATVRPQQINI